MTNIELIQHKIKKHLDRFDLAGLSEFILTFIPDITLDQIKQEFIADSQDQITRLDGQKIDIQTAIDSVGK